MNGGINSYGKDISRKILLPVLGRQISKAIVNVSKKVAKVNRLNQIVKPNNATQEIAINLAKKLEPIAQMYGAHVALTGGCLYKEGQRKDIDILFYRIRQIPEIDESGLLTELSNVGFIVGERYDWVVKSEWMGYSVDLFFPESKNNHKFPLKEGWSRYSE